MNIQKYTGDYYFKKRFLGGYDIYIEVEYTRTDPQTCTESPVFKNYIKANEEHIHKLFNTKTNESIL